MQTQEWYRERVSAPSLSDADQGCYQSGLGGDTGKDFTASFNARCPNCHHDAAILILRIMNKQENGGYILKRGIAFRYKGKVYTADNITAPAAEWYIAQDLKHRDDFEALAKDYDEYETVSPKHKEE